MISRESLLTCLLELADIEFQQRAWVDGAGSEISSFPELVCQTFDNTGLSDAIESQGLSHELDSHLAELLLLLNTAIESVDSTLPAALLIRSDAMKAVRDAANQAAKALTALEAQP